MQRAGLYLAKDVSKYENSWSGLNAYIPRKKFSLVQTKFLIQKKFLDCFFSLN